MPALNFQARFAPLVAAGVKRQTIREWRKRRIKVGDTLYLFAGMRRPGCTRLRTEVCRRETPIRITWHNITISGGDDIELLTPRQQARFARADGFASLAEFRNFFCKDGCHERQLIMW